MGRSVKDHLATRQWILNGVILHELLGSQSELRSDIQNVHTPQHDECTFPNFAAWEPLVKEDMVQKGPIIYSDLMHEIS